MEQTKCGRVWRIAPRRWGWRCIGGNEGRGFYSQPEALTALYGHFRRSAQALADEVAL